MSYKYKLDVFFSLTDHGKHIGMLIFMIQCIWTPSYSSNSNMAAVQKSSFDCSMGLTPHCLRQFIYKHYILHAHIEVQRTPALQHLQCPLHAFLHPQWRRMVQTLLASP